MRNELLTATISNGSEWREIVEIGTQTKQTHVVAVLPAFSLPTSLWHLKQDWPLISPLATFGQCGAMWPCCWQLHFGRHD